MDTTYTHENIIVLIPWLQEECSNIFQQIVDETDHPAFKHTLNHALFALKTILVQVSPGDEDENEDDLTPEELHEYFRILCCVFYCFQFCRVKFSSTVSHPTIQRSHRFVDEFIFSTLPNHEARLVFFRKIFHFIQPQLDLALSFLPGSQFILTF